MTSPSEKDSMFQKVGSDAEITTLAALAKEIWEEHFTPIIGAEQVAYMLDRFQSFSAIKNGIQRDGYQYYFLTLDGERIGYTGFRFENRRLFLSKLYIKKTFRGSGLARKTIEFLDAIARNEACDVVRLTCNRFNETTLAVYAKLGFQIVEAKDFDIGGGFWMNDYILERTVASI